MPRSNDTEAIAGYLATLVASVSVQAARMLASGGDTKSLDKNLGVGLKRGNIRTNGTEQPSADEATGDIYPPDPVDGLVPFTQRVLPNGLLQKKYQDGTLRLENPTSGVIQEERPDGSLLVSLPSGKLLYQEFPSDPMLAYDLNNTYAPPVPAGVALVNLPGSDGLAPVYHFRDQQGTHLVGLDSLRYYRVKQPAPVAAVR